MSDEREEIEYCMKCKKDTVMTVHNSISHPTIYTCMECSETYALVDGELLIFKESYEYAY
jgi:hypothetical protein